jgi:DNA-binding NarL/FixJ family response regulator
MRPANDTDIYCRKQNEVSAPRAYALSAPEEQRKYLTRIAVVDQRPFARDMIAQWIRRHHRGRIVMSFETVDSLLTGDSRLQTVKLLILGGFSTHEGGGSMSKAVGGVLDRRPDLPIIIIADCDEARVARVALQTGARAFLPLTSDSRVATAVINLVLAGGSYVPIAAANVQDDLRATMISPEGTSLSAEGFSNAYRSAYSARPVRLTPREADVLQLLLQSQPNKLIARRLGMHECTVKTHLSNLIRKFEVKNRTGVVLRAAAMGIPEIAEVDP